MVVVTSSRMEKWTTGMGLWGHAAAHYESDYDRMARMKRQTPSKDSYGAAAAQHAVQADPQLLSQSLSQKPKPNLAFHTRPCTAPPISALSANKRRDSGSDPSDISPMVPRPPRTRSARTARSIDSTVVSASGRGTRPGTALRQVERNDAAEETGAEHVSVPKASRPSSLSLLQHEGRAGAAADAQTSKRNERRRHRARYEHILAVAPVLASPVVQRTPDCAFGDALSSSSLNWREVHADAYPGIDEEMQVAEELLYQFVASMNADLSRFESRHVLYQCYLSQILSSLSARLELMEGPSVFMALALAYLLRCVLKDTELPSSGTQPATMSLETLSAEVIRAVFESDLSLASDTQRILALPHRLPLPGSNRKTHRSDKATDGNGVAVPFALRAKYAAREVLLLKRLCLEERARVHGRDSALPDVIGAARVRCDWQRICFRAWKRWTMLSIELREADRVKRRKSLNMSLYDMLDARSTQRVLFLAWRLHTRQSMLWRTLRSKQLKVNTLLHSMQELWNTTANNHAALLDQLEHVRKAVSEWRAQTRQKCAASLLFTECAVKAAKLVFASLRGQLRVFGVRDGHDLFVVAPRLQGHSAGTAARRPVTLYCNRVDKLLSRLKLARDSTTVKKLSHEIAVCAQLEQSQEQIAYEELIDMGPDQMLLTWLNSHVAHMHGQGLQLSGMYGQRARVHDLAFDMCDCTVWDLLFTSLFAGQWVNSSYRSELHELNAELAALSTRRRSVVSQTSHMRKPSTLSAASDGRGESADVDAWRILFITSSERRLWKKRAALIVGFIRDTLELTLIVSADAFVGYELFDPPLTEAIVAEVMQIQQAEDSASSVHGTDDVDTKVQIDAESGQDPTTDTSNSAFGLKELVRATTLVESQDTGPLPTRRHSVMDTGSSGLDKRRPSVLQKDPQEPRSSLLSAGAPRDKPLSALGAHAAETRVEISRARSALAALAQRTARAHLQLLGVLFTELPHCPGHLKRLVNAEHTRNRLARLSVLSSRSLQRDSASASDEHHTESEASLDSITTRPFWWRDTPVSAEQYAWRISLTNQLTFVEQRWELYVSDQERVGKQVSTAFLDSMDHVAVEINIWKQRAYRRKALFEQLRASVVDRVSELCGQSMQEQEDSRVRLLVAKAQGKSSLAGSLTGARRNGSLAEEASTPAPPSLLFDDFGIARVADLIRTSTNKTSVSTTSTVMKHKASRQCWRALQVLLGSHYEQLIHIFQYYASLSHTCQGKAVNLTVFMVFARDCCRARNDADIPARLGADVTSGLLNVIFAQCSTDSSSSDGNDTGKRQGAPKEDSNGEEKGGKFLSHAQFFEAIVRIGAASTPLSVGGADAKAKDSAQTSQYIDVTADSKGQMGLVDRVSHFLRRFVLVNAGRLQMGSFQKELQTNSAKHVFRLHRDSLQMVFKHFLDVKGDVKTMDGLTRDQFIRVMKDARIISSSFNEHVVGVLFSEVLFSTSSGGSAQVSARQLGLIHDDNNTLSMEQFQVALAGCAVYVDPNPFTPLAVKLESFLSAVLLPGLRRFAHVRGLGKAYEAYCSSMKSSKSVH